MHDFAHERFDFGVGGAVEHFWRRGWFAFARFGARCGLRARLLLVLRPALLTRFARRTWFTMLPLLAMFARITRLTLRLLLTLWMLTARLLLWLARLTIFARLLLAGRLFMTRMIVALRTPVVLIALRVTVALRFGCADVGGDAQFHVARAESKKTGAAFVDDFYMYFIALDAKLLEGVLDCEFARFRADFNGPHVFQSPHSEGGLSSPPCSNVVALRSGSAHPRVAVTPQASVCLCASFL